MTNSVVQISRFRAHVARALARRGKRLLESSELALRVSEMEPLEAYFVVKELGVEDALPILKHATVEQLQTFIDLDCWRDHRPDVFDIDAWLAPHGESGKLKLAQVFLALEAEMQILFLQEILEVYETRNEDAPPQRKDVPRFTTPDGYFIADAPTADKLEIDPVALLDGIYATDLSEAFRLLTAVKWELKSPLVEQAHSFRAGRLEDLGFPTSVDAQELFAPPRKNPPTQRFAPVETTLPAVYAQTLESESLLTRGLSRISEVEVLRALENELVYLINGAVVAFGESPQDLRHVSDIAEQVRDTLSLGLESLLSPDGPHPFLDGEDAAAQSAELLNQWPLRDLFRYGHAPARELQQTARLLHAEPKCQQWIATVETEADDYGEDRMDREFVRALLRPVPLMSGFDRLQPTQCKAFSNQVEVQQGRERLDRIASQRFGLS